MALTELARFLPRVHHHNRYLRAGARQHRYDDSPVATGPAPFAASLFGDDAPLVQTASEPPADEH